MQHAQNQRRSPVGIDHDIGKACQGYEAIRLPGDFGPHDAASGMSAYLIGNFLNGVTESQPVEKNALNS